MKKQKNEEKIDIENYTPKKLQKRRAKKQKTYFTRITQMAVCAYNKTDDHILKSKIYSRFLDFPFRKLIEIQINKHKFYYFDTTFEDLQHEVILHLLKHMVTYNSSLGKAYSYLTVVARNYLIKKNTEMYEQRKNSYDLVVVDDNRNIPTETEYDSRNDEVKDFINMYVEHFDKYLWRYFKTDDEKKIADSILDLFKNRHNLETYDKKILYVLIRERANVKSSQIANVIKFMKGKYIEFFEFYKENGKLPSQFVLYKDFM